MGSEKCQTLVLFLLRLLFCKSVGFYLLERGPEFQGSKIHISATWCSVVTTTVRPDLRVSHVSKRGVRSPTVSVRPNVGLSVWVGDSALVQLMFSQLLLQQHRPVSRTGILLLLGPVFWSKMPTAYLGPQTSESVLLSWILFVHLHIGWMVLNSLVRARTVPVCIVLFFLFCFFSVSQTLLYSLLSSMVCILT